MLLLFYLSGTEGWIFFAANVKTLEQKHCVQMGVDLRYYSERLGWPEKASFSVDFIIMGMVETNACKPGRVVSFIATRITMSPTPL